MHAAHAPEDGFAPPRFMDQLVCPGSVYGSCKITLAHELIDSVGIIVSQPSEFKLYSEPATCIAAMATV